MISDVGQGIYFVSGTYGWPNSTILARYFSPIENRSICNPRLKPGQHNLYIINNYKVARRFPSTYNSYLHNTIHIYSSCRVVSYLLPLKAHKPQLPQLMS